MGIFHQRIVFEDGFPVFLILAITSIFTGKLLDRNLMTVKVLKNEIAEVSSFSILAELTINIGLTGSGSFGRGLA